MRWARTKKRRDEEEEARKDAGSNKINLEKAEVPRDTKVVRSATGRMAGWSGRRAGVARP